MCLRMVNWSFSTGVLKIRSHVGRVVVAIGGGDLLHPARSSYGLVQKGTGNREASFCEVIVLAKKVSLRERSFHPAKAKIAAKGHACSASRNTKIEATRMRWTQKMNENVMRAYYGSTEGGTNLTAYRDRMLSLFQVLEPAVNVSTQRLSDQVRVIQRNHRLDDAALDRLRLEMLSSPMVTTSSQAAVPPPPSGGVTPRSNFVDGDEDNRAVTPTFWFNLGHADITLYMYLSHPIKLFHYSLRYSVAIASAVSK
ncbi:hypothetical protein B5X24_HaOG204583 [Helicoverpa armigera]|nr:hypothetical protein B5X24_HaOG204583 [Helicoverpa armigera]